MSDENTSKDTEDDVTIEPEAEESNPQAVIQKLSNKLKTVVEEKQDYLDRLKRAQADFVNIRKRDEESKIDFLKFANENLIIDLLPTLDSFEMAMANKEVWEKADKNWRTGVEYIYSQLRSALEKNGLKEVNPLCKKLDPSRDTPGELVPVSKQDEDGIILAVLQRGYELNGKLIRSPRVKVGHLETSETEAGAKMETETK